MAAPFPFHVAVPVNDLSACRQFYTEVIGCTVGRTSNEWVDLNLFGHQFVLHYKANHTNEWHRNAVDGHAVPVPHYGVVLDWETWHAFADRLNKHQVEFVIEPYIRFQGEVGEQATLFFADPSGNALEFKAFKQPDQLFAS